MNPSWRKPAGVLGILLFLAVYGSVFMHFADAISALPQLAQFLIYLTAGITWIAPLGPVLAWMETGKFR